MSEKTIYRLPEVMARTGLSRSSIYAKIANNEFPPPISLGLRSVGWVSDDLTDWINGQIRASRGQQP